MFAAGVSPLIAWISGLLNALTFFHPLFELLGTALTAASVLVSIGAAFLAYVVTFRSLQRQIGEQYRLAAIERRQARTADFVSRAIDVRDDWANRDALRAFRTAQVLLRMELIGALEPGMDSWLQARLYDWLQLGAAAENGTAVRDQMVGWQADIEFVARKWARGEISDEQILRIAESRRFPPPGQDPVHVPTMDDANESAVSD